MFSLVKQVPIVLWCFSSSFATKFRFVNDEPCMVRPTLFDLYPVELKHYPSMISLEKCNGSFSVLLLKTCVPKETKDINVKVFNMITNKNEAKTMTKHISCNCKCKFNSQHVIQIKNEIKKHVNVSVKIIVHAKKIIVVILAHVFVITASI